MTRSGPHAARGLRVATPNLVTTQNSAENEIRYIIVTVTERGDRGECHCQLFKARKPKI